MFCSDDVHQNTGLARAGRYIDIYDISILFMIPNNFLHTENIEFNALKYDRGTQRCFWHAAVGPAPAPTPPPSPTPPPPLLIGQ